ncbi:MAG: potassium transporter [Halobacteriovoraceae bacterium]|nr:potassium transporter [Halobacteriovoraceae bacterium]|tara:strand:+ start:5511 stop:7445 length:1935 start_codon:yes stop_codon:yes gene_type:complete
MTQVFLIAGLFLLAGTIVVPLATRFKLGSVLGYIFAGILISPLLSIFKVNVKTLQHFAEFGVVMMLFLVGLELQPKTLWKMKSKLLGLGGLQILLTIVLLGAISTAFGLPFKTALTVSFIFCLSSTAIVLQTLNEKGLLSSDGGKDSFSVLLVQDIAVIPMLAIIPLLAIPELADHAVGTLEPPHSSFSLVHGLEAWQRGGITLFAIASVILGGVLLSRPFFRFVASAKLREVLVATALLWVVGISSIMSLVELSPALGTFIAGVVLANSEYKHQLETDIEPFKGLLLGLFFITVGASIDFKLFFDEIFMVIFLTSGVMFVKGFVLYILSRIFKMQGSNRWLFTLGLAQAGEFAFVLLSFSVSSYAISKELADLLMLVVALSMLLTPGLFIFHERYLSKKPTSPKRDDDKIDEEHPIIIAGHGRFGGVVNRLLRGLGYKTTVLDYSYNQLEVLRKFDIEVYYGDVTRHDLLLSAGIDQAKIFVIAIDNRKQTTELVKYCTKNFPNLHVIARAFDRHHVYDLYAAGCRDIIRECFDSSVRMGRSTLEAMGMHPFEAERKTRSFVETDQEMIRALATVYDPNIPVSENKEYIATMNKVRKATESILQGSHRIFGNRSDRGWVPPTKKDVETAIKEGTLASNTTGEA